MNSSADSLSPVGHGPSSLLNNSQLEELPEARLQNPKGYRRALPSKAARAPPMPEYSGSIEASLQAGPGQLPTALSTSPLTSPFSWWAAISSSHGGQREPWGREHIWSPHQPVMGNIPQFICTCLCWMLPPAQHPNPSPQGILAQSQPWLSSPGQSEPKLLSL